jgi:hypothetical protein
VITEISHKFFLVLIQMKVNTTPVVVANNSPYDGYGVMPPV